MWWYLQVKFSSTRVKVRRGLPFVRVRSICHMQNFNSSTLFTVDSCPKDRKRRTLATVPDPDLKIRGGGGGGDGLQKNYFRTFGSQFGLKIRRGRAPRAPPLDTPLCYNEPLSWFQMYPGRRPQVSRFHTLRQVTLTFVADTLNRSIDDGLDNAQAGCNAD